MARPRKYSTDSLLLIVKDYLVENEYITKLTYADLEKYSKRIGYKDINWQDFGRNFEVKSFVKEYNKQKKITMYTKLNYEKLTKLNFDVETIVEKNIKDKRQLKAILKIFKEGYDRAFEKIINNDEIITEYKMKIEEQNKTINKLNKQNKELKNKLKEFESCNKLNRNIERDKYMYSLLKYIIDNKNIPINTSEDVLNLLKNIVSDKNSDVENSINILRENYTMEKEVTKKEKVITIKENKLKIPNFITKNRI
ncbi:hypothetical protein QTI99_06510 [Clostridium perfringens]|uniref:hypothetical protein n=1 Tax=Clostridium perfringens TaxID=1502 RepID=UPI002906F803|nr:hypothetical protein [Clostridium perfringens]EJT6170773.1 hypothetical protein [Clostridium perfringens]EJT6541498.1 hypothetical protein [Clostridium perfringens]EJT6566505.1 hypothetical protein [Clostridium perfringens]MBS5994760.1 hypothetical protein [Clostridium perfringens]MDM0997113.1 hypothetical protein [Clostridium perfringens]